VVERQNQTDMTSSMLKAKQLPSIFFGEAVMDAVYMLNRTTPKGNGRRTPYELWLGSTPTVHHLRTFGCVAHIKTTRNMKKLDNHSKPVIFVGYEPGSNVYHTYVTSDFKIKTICLSYVCPGISCHTYSQNINTENKCLYYINFITRILSLHRRLYRLSRQAATE
jgi:hypothetical protein